MARILVVDPDPSLSRTLTSLLSRFEDRVQWAKTPREASSQLARGGVDLLVVDERISRKDPLEPFEPVLRAGNPPTMFFSEPRGLKRLIEAYRRGVASCVIKPFHPRELLSGTYALLRRQRRIVCLGGGTGLYVLLLGLKKLPNVHLTSIVSMSDDGGSTGRIREAFGVLPPGDVRRSLAALSTAPALLNELMRYRFPAGEGLEDHNFGNLFLAATADLRGSMAEAVRAMGDILNIQGMVLPVTSTMNTLVAELADGTVLRGEHRIDVPEGRDPQIRITRLWQEPEAIADPNALSAILAADLVTIGPGDLFTSIVATLAVSGIAEAIRAARGRKVYIGNLMTKPGETTGLTAADHIQEVVRYLGGDVLDEVLVSNTALSQEAIRQYTKRAQEPVRLDEPARFKDVTSAQVLVRDIGSEYELVRHHSEKLANEMAHLLISPSAAQPVTGAQGSTWEGTRGDGPS